MMVTLVKVPRTGNINTQKENFDFRFYCLSCFALICIMCTNIDVIEMFGMLNVVGAT